MRNFIGDLALMRERLERTLESIELLSVTLQVLPFDSGTYPATGSFTLLGFPTRRTRTKETDGPVVAFRSHPWRAFIRGLEGDRRSAVRPS
ncbi:Scr1 family TA system antitoxin-like transcriptional regulator [Streptomyces sp. NPDC088358]|uniref:Scr1 family TA system antitoxin-like transcriptional regulator n=1 Tax=Streptomyces sp. NPDC088358 TaxID=3365857 RepID=UPI00380B4D4C